MKKLFFFRSSSSSGNNPVPPPSTDKQVYWENPLENELTNQFNDNVENSFRSPKGLFTKLRKQTSESQSSANSPHLRRSLSFSSAAAFHGSSGSELRNSSCFSDRSRSPSSSSCKSPPKHCDHSSRCRSLTPERHLKPKQFEVATVRSGHKVGRAGPSGYHRDCNDSSGSSSFCSGTVSSRVLDLYIDGEQQQERNKPKNGSFQRNHAASGNCGGRRPPKVQYTAPTSPSDSIKEKLRSCSFREPIGTQLYFSSKDWVETGFGHESPRKLAKKVIERLSQSNVSSKTSLKDVDPDTPITIEDVYGGSLNRLSESNLDGVGHKICPLNEPYETINGHHCEEVSGFQEQNYFLGDNFGGSNSVDAEESIDVELQRKVQEAEKRFLLLSEEFELGNFLRESEFNMSALVQTIRNLTEERISLVLEVSNALQGRIKERASAKEQLRLAKTELDSQIRKLEREKNELQSGLEKELDRRSSDWSFKLERYQSEEQRLRDRVRELAEQNVSLQREVSFLNEREADSRRRITHFELQLKDLTTKFEEASGENRDFQQNLYDIKQKYIAAEEARDCIQRNYEEKEKESKELHKSITKLLRTCSEQEKTVDGLRELIADIENKQSYENIDKHVGKLQMEQLRLTGVEQTLRREVESYKLEVGSLRHENINLLNRLKGSGKEGGFSTFKLDQELGTRICCLQSQGLSLLNESTQLCSKLLEFIKGKASQIVETKQGIEIIKNCLDGHFVVESDVKIQGFRRGTESLARSLQAMSSLLNEKSNMDVLEFEPRHGKHGESGKLYVHASEEMIRSELKAENLLTSLLRDKLYSRELEVEQLQAELATAVRGNDMLRCEVQNVMDTLSCVTHKLKDVELQMLKKDEKINGLQNDLEDSAKEMAIMRGVLPKISQERDLMWEEVKQYSEKNMLLNSEVNMLKKKIEVLDEDVLLKEGQITILKDKLGNSKIFDLFASPESTRSTREFFLE